MGVATNTVDGFLPCVHPEAPTGTHAEPLRPPSPPHGYGSGGPRMPHESEAASAATQRHTATRQCRWKASIQTRRGGSGYPSLSDGWRVTDGNGKWGA